VAIARGEQDYFDPAGIATATEACKSNALMRCCKDLGIASELWCVARLPQSLYLISGCRDPRFIREFKTTHCVEVFVEHQGTKKKYGLILTHTRI
jgi:Mitochondrial genome maintenance MGM101